MAFSLTKRIAKIVIGFALLLAGLVMLVTPGPGWVTIAVGLALLSTEFRWARHLLDRIKEKGIQLRDAVRGSAR
ncbi:MAG: PGPGW domain-containing protein [Acidobacteriia bacterium]|nr:PGPGW domain-containing protein [Terriglobia bacterium]